MEVKMCYRYNQEKYVSEFYNGRKTKDWFQTECKTCKNELYLLNKEKFFLNILCPRGKTVYKN